MCNCLKLLLLYQTSILLSCVWYSFLILYFIYILKVFYNYNPHLLTEFFQCRFRTSLKSYILQSTIMVNLLNDCCLDYIILLSYFIFSTCIHIYTSFLSHMRLPIIFLLTHCIHLKLKFFSGPQAMGIFLGVIGKVD